MASFNLLVEDCSPLVSYAPAGAWVDANNDTLITSYSGHSLHTTSAQGANATFDFNGTGVTIIGGRRPGYGGYEILVDGQVISSGNARNAVDSPQQELGTVSNLPNGRHTVVLRSTGGGAIDIDAIKLDTAIGSSGGKLATTTIDDSDPQIKYLPSPDAWRGNLGPNFMNNTLRYTQTPGASASLSFTGDAVALYGTVSPDHANIRVNIDGRDQVLPGGGNSLTSGLHTQVLLYYATNLGAASHTMTISAADQPGGGPFLDLDAVTVFSAMDINNGGAAPSPSNSPPSQPSSESGRPTSSSATSQSPQSLPTGTVAGAVIGALIGLILIASLVVFLLKRRRAPKKRNTTEMHSPLSPELPMQSTPDMLEAGYGAKPALSFTEYVHPQKPKTTYDRHSIAPSYYGTINSRLEPSRPPSRASSTASTAPMIQDVPQLDAPPIPKRLKSTGAPVRPTQRPPTMEFGSYS